MKFYKRPIFVLLFVLFAFPLILAGCQNKSINLDDYFSENEDITYPEVDLTRRLLNVLEQEGYYSDDRSTVFIYIPYSEGTNSARVALFYNYEDKNFSIFEQLLIDNSEIGSLLQFTVEERGCSFFCTYKNNSGLCYLNKDEITSLSYIFFDEYNGLDSIKSPLEDIGLTMLQGGIEILDLYLESYNINFIEDYFS